MNRSSDNAVQQEAVFERWGDEVFDVLAMNLLSGRG